MEPESSYLKMLFVALLVSAVFALPVDASCDTSDLQRRSPIGIMGPCVAAAAFMSSDAFAPTQRSFLDRNALDGVVPKKSYGLSVNRDPRFGQRPVGGVPPQPESAPVPRPPRPDIAIVQADLWTRYLKNLKMYSNPSTARAKALAGITESLPMLDDAYLLKEETDAILEWFDSRIMQQQFATMNELGYLKNLKNSNMPIPKNVRSASIGFGLEKEFDAFKKPYDREFKDQSF